MIKQYKKWLKGNMKEHNPHWPQTSNHPYRILTIGGSWYGKRNLLPNLIIQQPSIDKIYLFDKNPYEVKYQD